MCDLRRKINPRFLSIRISFSRDESSDGNSTLFPFQLFLPENNFFSTLLFFSLPLFPPRYRHLSRRIDYAKIIFSNNQLGSTQVHRVSPKRVAGSVATSEWISLDDNRGQRGNLIPLLVDSTDSRGKVTREREREKRGRVPSARHCAPLNCSHCDPRVLQIPIRALWPGINPFP